MGCAPHGALALAKPVFQLCGSAAIGRVHAWRTRGPLRSQRQTGPAVWGLRNRAEQHPSALKTEASDKAKRPWFSTAYKQRILREATACTELPRGDRQQDQSAVG